jgi:RNA polymerase sigma-70 factor (ECF subfamily)
MKDADDQTSWQDFFDTYWKLIYAVALKAGLNDAEAQDVVQETVLTVTRKIKDFETTPERGSFKGWLMQITRWRIADQFRKRPPPAAHLSAANDGTSCTSTAERVVDPASLELERLFEENWKHNLKETALANLKRQVDPEQYQMFDLHVLKDWPAVRVARQLGVKMGRVYFAKYKITRLLRREVKHLQAKLG